MTKLDWYRLVLHLGILNVRFCLSDLIVSFIGGNSPCKLSFGSSKIFLKRRVVRLSLRDLRLVRPDRVRASL